MNYQLSRRNFLQASIAIALTQLASSCSSQENNLQILYLERSIPPQLIRDFHNLINDGKKINFKPEIQLSQIFDSLINLSKFDKLEQNNKVEDRVLNKSINYPDLSTLGDAWLASAISQNLIQPLSLKEIAAWQNLPASWQKLVRRDSQGYTSDDGEVYGAPYRWGSTVIVYNRDKIAELGLKIEDWQDLWQPELRDRLSLLDSPREVIGLTLKKLGRSYNSEDLNIPDLESELLALHRQVKLYSSERYLEPLILGDTLVAVAWSADVLPLRKRYPELEFIIPQSGTSLWADLWVKPRVELLSSEDSESRLTAIEKWIDYCWQPQAAKQISLFTDGISPILSVLERDEIPQDLQDNIFLNSAVLNSENSEFLLPLTPAAERQYRDLWLKMRQSHQV